MIIPAEIDELHSYGVTRLYSPADGQTIGLQGMIDDMIAKCRQATDRPAPPSLAALAPGDRITLTRALTAIESDHYTSAELEALEAEAKTSATPVLGITGTGGAGK